MSPRTILRGTVAFLAALFLSASANAQLFRAYLASDGSDANPCTLPQPCRLLPAALTAVASGGEIWMLDSANYNTTTVTIGKSVSILAIPGAVGSVVAAAGSPAISITAASLTVALRNLVIVPFLTGGSAYGVFMSGASSLTIEDSLVANHPQTAVHVVGAGTVKIVDTIIRNNFFLAVHLLDGATGTISRTQILQNGGGGVIASATTATTTTASVSDSVVSGGNACLRSAATIAGGSAKMFVTGSTIEGCVIGLASLTNDLGSALLTVSNSMVTNNDTGWGQAGAGSVMKSLGNNHVEDNANPPFGSPTLTALQ